jgi:hypothetical protein
MPPVTPSTMRAGRDAASGWGSKTEAGSAGVAGVAGVTAHPPTSGFDRLGGQQLAVDLTQRDRERLLVRMRLDERAHVLEKALAQL